MISPMSSHCAMRTRARDTTLFSGSLLHPRVVSETARRVLIAGTRRRSAPPRGSPRWPPPPLRPASRGRSLGAEMVGEEVVDPAAAVAGEADHREVGRGVARNHREQGRLADARAREDAHALAATAGEEGVDRAHAEIDLAGDALARMR